MKELYAKHHEADGVEVIGMSRDNDETTPQDQDEIGMPWMHVYDQDGSISRSSTSPASPRSSSSRTGEMLGPATP
ncbi:MAG: hypothetical protein R3C45_20855 [Phycisphaerales bacterium]